MYFLSRQLCQVRLPGGSWFWCSEVEQHSMVIDIGSLSWRRQIIKPRDLPSPALLFSLSYETVIVTPERRGNRNRFLWILYWLEICQEKTPTWMTMTHMAHINKSMHSPDGILHHLGYTLSKTYILHYIYICMDKLIVFVCQLSYQGWCRISVSRYHHLRYEPWLVYSLGCCSWPSGSGLWTEHQQGAVAWPMFLPYWDWSFTTFQRLRGYDVIQYDNDSNMLCIYVM